MTFLKSFLSADYFIKIFYDNLFAVTTFDGYSFPFPAELKMIFPTDVNDGRVRRETLNSVSVLPLE